MKFFKEAKAFFDGKSYFGWKKPKADDDPTLLLTDTDIIVDDSCQRPPERESIKRLPNGGWSEELKNGKIIKHWPEPKFVQTL